MNPMITPLQADLGLKPDGMRGPVTTAAILRAADQGRLTVLDSAASEALNPAVPMTAAVAAERIAAPTYAGLPAFYGPPGGLACSAGRIRFPFPFRLAYDPAQRLASVVCHVKLEAAFTSIFAQAAQHYGETEFCALGLDLIGGCYNDRNMRGSSTKSVHAWGAAYDVDPARNQLKWGADKAALDHPDYLPFWRIVEAHGAYSLGRERDFDWMHFQFCTV